MTTTGNFGTLWGESLESFSNKHPSLALIVGFGKPIGMTNTQSAPEASVSIACLPLKMCSNGPLSHLWCTCQGNSSRLVAGGAAPRVIAETSNSVGKAFPRHESTSNTIKSNILQQILIY